MGYSNIGKCDDTSKTIKFLLLSSLLVFGLLSLMLGVFIISASAVAGCMGLIGAIVDGCFGNALPGLVSALFCMALVCSAFVADIVWGKFAWLLLALLGLLLSGGGP
jgi:hypothetical protein